MPTACPPQNQLLKLAHGELPDAALEAVCDHVAACPHCEAVVAALEFGGVAANLRQYAGHDPWVRTEEFSRLEVWACALPVRGAAAAAVAEAVTLPIQVGQYQLVRELGRGGMGAVYEAVHTVLGRAVAVKVILPALAEDPEVLARFRREIAAVGPLAHPNVVAATDAGEADGRLFLVTELVDGLDLAALQRRVRRLSVADACEAARQAALGLQALADAGRVHRDLKPSNLMLSADGVVKVLDLGLARVLADRAADVTGPNQVMGTADYMAPEQWSDGHAADARTDVYSLGCTLHQLLLGSPPPGRGPGRAVVPLPPPRSLRPDIPPGLEAVLVRMLAVKPADRYATPGAVALVLRPFAGGADLRAVVAAARGAGGPPPELAAAETAPLDLPTPRDNPRRPGPLRWRLGAVAVALVGAVATGLAVNRNPAPSTASRPADAPEPPDAVTPRPADLAGSWRSLFAAQPTPLVWENRRQDHHLALSDDRRELRVETPNLGLVSFGEAGRAYRFRVGVRQVQWTGGVGVFLGYRPIDWRGAKADRFQLIEVVRTKSGPAAGEFALHRGWGVVTPTPTGRRMTYHHGVNSAPVGKLVGGRRYDLVVDVTRGGLAVWWNGRLLPQLADPGQDGPFTAADAVGPLGGMTQQCAATFHEPQLLPLEDRP